MNQIVNSWRFQLIFFFLGSISGLADDVGITKARLIQESERSYVVEADVTQVLVWAIKAPIFPDRFQVSELEYVTQSGWIIVRARVATNGDPLSAEDSILLPWARNGADLTVQWLDGTLQRGLFLRSLEGIHVPIRLLMPSANSLRETCFEHFSNGIKHLSFIWIHFFFIGALVFFPAPFKSLFFFAFGQALSMVLSDLGLPGSDLIFADMLGIILIFLLAYSARQKVSIDGFLPLLVLYGLIHGLAYAHELSVLELGLDQRLPALFMFNVGIDVGHFTGALVLIPLVLYLSKLPMARQIAIYCLGALTVAFLALLFQEHVAAGKTDILSFGGAQSSNRFRLPFSPNEQAGSQRPQGARQLTSPIMSYLSVEPFEVRQEVLMRARAAVQFLGVDEKKKGSIPLESLEPVKKSILSVFQRVNTISIDGQAVEPVLARADFVTLGPAGVILREAPVQESLDNGIIGLTLVYETSELAGEISIRWHLFSPSVRRVEATTIDPFGGATIVLSPDENVLNWTRRLSGYRVPVVEEIVVEKQRLPVVSLLLFLTVLLVSGFSIRRGKMLAHRTVLLSVTGLGLLLYPFLRITVDIPQWKPSSERTSIILDDLLTNVYRSFDVRDENDVYDRLAISVIGDQLTEIYLDSRRSLEFENRGGARATVDEVEILSVDDVHRSQGGEYVADTTWTVDGSVDHFGHTHYRRNRYHASVTFTAVDDTWKIRRIELIEEERLL